MNNYVYRYEQFVVKKTTDGGFVVVNTKSSYEHHSHVKTIQAGKALCKLAAKHKLPKNNDLYFIESLIRLTNNKKEVYTIKKQLVTNDINELGNILKINSNIKHNDIKILFPHIKRTSYKITDKSNGNKRYSIIERQT